MTFWNVKQVAEALGVGARTVRAWCLEKRIPHFRFEDQYRFDPDEVKTWIEARHQGVALKKK